MESFCISNLNLKIKFCEICCHDSDWKEHKTKTEYTLWMVEEGNIIIDYKKTKNEVFPGDIVFFYPGQAYNAFCTTKSCKFLVVFFRMDTNTMIHSIETQELSGIYRNSSSLAKRLIRTHKKYPASYAGYDIHVYLGLAEILCDLLGKKDSRIPFSQESIRANELKINKLTEYISAHITEENSVAQMAAFMGMSEKYFIRYFHIHTGKSPKQYVIECRMQEAVGLLTGTQMSLSEIAQRLNYSDMYAFSKAFKKCYGESPSVFRKSYSVV